jgi:hypothetical protein
MAVSEKQTRLDSPAFIGGHADKSFAFFNKNILFYCYILKLGMLNAAMTGTAALSQRECGCI